MRRRSRVREMPQVVITNNVSYKRKFVIILLGKIHTFLKRARLAVGLEAGGFGVDQFGLVDI